MSEVTIQQLQISQFQEALQSWEQALENYQHGLAIVQVIGAQPEEGIWLGKIGALLDRQNQPELAIVFYKQSVNTRIHSGED